MWSKKTGAAAALAAVVGISGGPAAHAYRGPRGGTATTGPRGGVTAEGPHGGEAAVGPHGSAAAVGPKGGTAVQGPAGYGHAYGAQGGQAQWGPHGGAAVGPQGGVAVSNRSYYGGGYHYTRPAYSSTQINVYQRSYVGYPGWHPYGAYYGLTPTLAAYSGLAFLSAGLLMGTYALAAEASRPPQTVYVYVVEQNGTKMEYRVTSSGQILSATPIP